MMTIDQTLKRDLLKTKTPGASADPNPVEAGLQSGADLDQHLVASSKQVLHKTIDFRPAEKDISFQLQNLRVKYVALNPSPPEAVESGTASSSKHSQMNGQVEVKNDGIPAPKKILYPFEKIALSWQRCQRVGPGLINLGNTCFLNATLQCLTYTPPLTNYLLTHQHKSECREPGFCIMCELCNHVHRTFNHQQNGQAIRPMVILHRLKHFAKHMHVGRQEDAHEFLRLLIEAMQKACIHGLDKLDRYSKETSLVYQIFSGYYRSRVICSVCQNKSDTFDPFLDIGLDIKQAPTVTKALERLIRPEMLDGENLYQCKKCSRKVQAQKRFTIQRSPAVLTLCLKRFDFNRFSMGKINKDLAYSENLNLRPYMSDPKGPPIMYELYAVLKHEGASCNSGHYYCYVKAANQSWYCMNDAFVSQVSLQRVLNQNAYLLFYIRKSNFKSPMNGGESKRDVMHTNNPKPATTISKPQSLFNGPVGVPVPRPSISTHPQQNAGFKPTVITEDKQKRPLQEQKQEQPQQEARHHLPKMIPLPVQREKLSFQFRPKGSGLGSPNSHGQQPVLVTKKQSPTTAPIKSPVVTGSGDATRQVQSEKSSTTTTTTTVFSPLRPNPTSPPALGSPKHPLQGLVKPKSRTPQDASNMNGICKKQTGSGLVPYTAEDSNSSSDSDTNYDQVAEALSRNPAGDAATQTPKITDKSTTKSQDEQKDVSRIENQPDTTPMRPPAAAKTLPSEGLQLSPTHLKKAGLANSINLTTIRKPDSPLKLTITTNGQAQRLKSTTHWRTADSDSQISPSPASDCSLHSNVSTNSTSEWNILEKKDAPQTPEEVKKEAAVFGWNITPSKSVNSEKSASDTEERRTTIKGPKTALKFDNIQDQTAGEKDLKKKLSHSKEETKGSTVTSHTVVESSSVPKESDDKVTDNEDLQVQGTSVDLKPQIDSEVSGTSLKSEKSPERGTSEECGDVTTAKKKKKKKKQHLSPTDESFAELDKSELLLSESNTDKEPAEGASLPMSSRETGNASDSLLETPKKHKKKKKKKKKKEKLEEEEEVELVEEWVERVVEPQIHDDRVPLLSDSKTHTDKHKKERDSHDKHKSIRNLDSHSDEDEASHKHSTSYKKHKEKHSLIRRTIEKNIKLHRNRHSSSDDSRETSSRHNGHRRDSHSDSHHKRTFSHKRTHSNHESSLEHSKHYKESRKRHSSDDHSGSDYPAKIRLLEDDSPVDSHREKKKRKHSDSYRHRHSSDSKHSKSHKEHGNRDSDKDGKYSEKSPRLNGDDDSNSHRKEKKKKRKHRDEDEVEEALHHRGREDEDYKPEKKKKKKKKKDRPLDEEEESTRDVDDAVTKHKHEDKVPVQQWDHHIQDGHRKHSDDSNKSKTHATWDGSHSASGVMEELGKASLKSYGPAIKSWDGGRSVLDNEVEQDSRKDRQRDPYEEDFDRGKVKKVKKHHDDSRRKMFSGRHNIFQSVQNMRNKVSKEHHGYSRFSHQSHEERPR